MSATSSMFLRNDFPPELPPELELILLTLVIGYLIFALWGAVLGFKVHQYFKQLKTQLM